MRFFEEKKKQKQPFKRDIYWNELQMFTNTLLLCEFFFLQIIFSNVLMVTSENNQMKCFLNYEIIKSSLKNWIHFTREVYYFLRFFSVLSFHSIESHDTLKWQFLTIDAYLWLFSRNFYSLISKNYYWCHFKSPFLVSKKTLQKCQVWNQKKHNITAHHGTLPL